MNDFLNRLSRSLKHMSPQAKQEILEDYREHFEIGLAEGKTEEQIVQSLGDPVQLAKMYSALNASRQAHQSKSFSDVLRMIGAVLSYKVGGGIFIGILYLICFMALFGMFGAAVGLVLAGAACVGMIVVEIVHSYIAYAFTAFFAALLLGCGGVLYFLGNMKLWRLSIGNLPLLARRITQHDAGRLNV